MHLTMDEIIHSHSIQWIAANEAAPASKVNDSNSLDLRSFLITYNIANLVLIRFGLARLGYVKCIYAVFEPAKRERCLHEPKHRTSRYTVVSIQPTKATNQPVNSTLNANLVSVIVLMEIFTSFFATFFFLFSISISWCNGNVIGWHFVIIHLIKKNHFFMIL